MNSTSIKPVFGDIRKMQRFSAIDATGPRTSAQKETAETRGSVPAVFSVEPRGDSIIFGLPAHFAQNPFVFPLFAIPETGQEAFFLGRAAVVNGFTAVGRRAAAGGFGSTARGGSTAARSRAASRSRSAAARSHFAAHGSRSTTGRLFFTTIEQARARLGRRRGQNQQGNAKFDPSHGLKNSSGEKLMCDGLLLRPGPTPAGSQSFRGISFGYNFAHISCFALLFSFRNTMFPQFPVEDNSFIHFSGFIRCHPCECFGC